MRRLLTSSLILFILFFAGAAYALFLHAPKIAAQKTQAAFSHIGINAAAPANPDISYGAITFNDIPMDAEGFSALKQLNIEYNPLSLLIFGKIKSATLTGLNLTGELSTDMALTIAGWDNTTLDKLRTGFALETLDIRDARLSILTPQFGGVNMLGNIQVSRKKDNVIFQGRIESSQKHLGFNTGLSGTLNKQGIWQATLDFDKGRFETDTIKTSRANGKIQIEKTPMQPLKILSSFEAGGLSIHDFAWQNATGSFEGNSRAYNLFVDANSIGVEGLEISMNKDTTQVPSSPINGQLHAKNIKTLFDYLQTQGVIAPDIKISPLYMNTPDIAIEFKFDQSDETAEKTLNYSLKNQEKDIDINGIINFKTKDIYSGTLSGSPVFLNKLDPDNFNDGSIAFAGDFSKNTARLNTTLKAELKNAAFNAEGMKISNISGDIVFGDALSLNTKDIAPLSCTLPITPDHQCTINLAMVDGALNFKSIKTKFFDSTIEAQNFNPLSEGSGWTFKINNLNLWKLTEALDFEGVTGTGKLSGEIPIIKQDGKLTIKDGVISNKGSGIIRYLYDDNPDFFEGDELELETIRMALRNYHYNTVKIRMNGPLDGDINMVITGAGKNPDLSGARNISLHLKTKTNAAKLLKNILQQ